MMTETHTSSEDEIVSDFTTIRHHVQLKMPEGYSMMSGKRKRDAEQYGVLLIEPLDKKEGSQTYHLRIYPSIQQHIEELMEYRGRTVNTMNGKGERAQKLIDAIEETAQFNKR